MPITLIQEQGTRKMAEAFNLNTFLSEQQTYTQRKYTNAENAQAAMEARDIERAEEAVANNGLLSLTLGEKLNLIKMVNLVVILETRQYIMLLIK